MFLDELTPIAQGLIKQPVAFCGGLLSGVLRLDIGEDPLKTWLEKQGASVEESNKNNSQGTNEGPQSISIE